MLLFYNIAIYAYYFIIKIASTTNTKAKLWVAGRRDQQFRTLQKSAWFHFASLGEFEQGRPVLEAFKVQHPGHPIVVTFFSPSGYEVRKNTPLADAVYYLPLDTANNARQFIDTIDPVIAVFTKYEYWYHFYNEAHQRNIPLYVISAIFRPKQLFFKCYGGLHRQILGKVTRFFVQDEDSKTRLSTIGINNVMVSGDTRFDRVYANALAPKQLPLIERFKNNARVFIAGSTWPADEELIAPLITEHPDWKFIFAPHEIPEAKIIDLMGKLPADRTVRFSHIKADDQYLASKQVLVIDNIGMLSSLYQYGDVAYIGGGFGVGIHNTLETAAFGSPVIFGPNYQKFKEARDLVDLGGGFSISDAQQLKTIADQLINNDAHREQAGAIAKELVQRSKGATQIIMQNIEIRKE
ncbi:3-deoxy-D-manno-octulosonic acid transferase [Mucilaginibacter daejeonensis]|uniref:3-deoxy-D-manno-octulosonic acid transferase n=1 Tax=Mucilaginibacter daejeonensis TaxID=398049 RepID=UPI001D17B6AB|nr:glycosyltransferase N-terminal domain-containing protein [Mucilaginibacter daejeonensis]UEG53648.1 3-deoxy-D-manno-octulosonic acid transferase [Mucilaginibacter daejeonensis]